MSTWDYIVDARQRYIDGLRQSLHAEREKGSVCSAEVWVQPNARPGSDTTPSLICIDILCQAGEKRRAIMVSSEEPPSGGMIGALAVGAAKVPVFPITWEILIVWFRHAELDPAALDGWRKKWMDPDRASDPGDPDGLCGSVHHLDGPDVDGGGYRYVVDFGSAPAEALTELLAELEASGAIDMEIGRSDGSHLDPEVISELRAPELSIQRVTELFARLLHALPELESAEVVGAEDIEARMKGSSEKHHIFTGNLFARLQRVGPEARLGEVWHFLRSQREGFQDAGPPDLSQLQVLIKDDRFVEYLLENGKSMSLLARRLIADLWTCCVWDESNGMRFVRDDEPEQYGLSADAFHARARENFLAESTENEITAHGPLLVARRQDPYVATLLLDDAFWIDIAQRVAGEVLVCAPARDTLLITGSEAPDAVAALREAAARISAGGDHLISGTILIRAGDRWQKFLGENDPLAEPDRPPTSGGRADPPSKRRWWRFW